MKLLIFDTETTGLPRIKIPALTEPNNWPHIVSISWIILDSTTNKIEKQKSFVIKPLGWHIPEESTKIHKITHEYAVDNGSDLASVLGIFMAEKYDVLVSHNIDFDTNVLYNAIKWDLEMPFNSLKKQLICTMNLSRSICKIKGNFGSYKYPKLSELYYYAFKEFPKQDSLHSSMYDVLILTEIIQYCNELRLKMNLHPINTVITTTNANQTNSERVLCFRLDESI